MSQNYKYMEIDQHTEHVYVLTINNPPVNVLQDDLLDELNAVIDELTANENIRTLIVAGAGEKAFVAGADISQFPSMNNESGKKLADKGKRIIDKFEDAPFPVIAALNGFTLGGGLELALACDFRIAAENAKLGLPEVGLGVYPGYAGTQRLPRLIGIGKAKQLVYVADPISAEEAYRIGLVEEFTPVGEAVNVAKTFAEKIATRGPLAIRYSKKVMNEGADLSLADAQDLETEYFGVLADSEDKNEGASAFQEKRTPEFKGK